VLDKIEGFDAGPIVSAAAVPPRFGQLVRVLPEAPKNPGKARANRPKKNGIRLERWTVDHWQTRPRNRARHRNLAESRQSAFWEARTKHRPRLDGRWRLGSVLT